VFSGISNRSNYLASKINACVWMLSSWIKKNVKCTLVKTLRLCTGCMAYGGSRDIVLLFLDHGTRRVSGQGHTALAFNPQEGPSNQCRGPWVDPRASLDRCRNSHPHRNSIPDHPALSQSLYRLCYLAQIMLNAEDIFCSLKSFFRNWSLFATINQQKIRIVLKRVEWIFRK
jgi:hypothetical protein